MKKKYIKYIIEVVGVLALFLIVSYIVQANLDLIRGAIENDFLGMFVYLLIVSLEVILAPISALPLMPLASNLWGWFLGGLLTLVGWTIGSLIAFIISRKYGVWIVEKFVSLDDIRDFEKQFPRKKIFFSVILVRIVLPIDLVSYALGLFTKIKTRDYVIASAIGFAPFAFIFAYLGILPIWYQVIGIVLGLIVLGVGIWMFFKKRGFLEIKIN